MYGLMSESRVDELGDNRAAKRAPKRGFTVAQNTARSPIRRMRAEGTEGLRWNCSNRIFGVVAKRR